MLNVLDLVLESGLRPKKVASTKGGEYKCSCPKCQEGKDRFCVWPKQGSTGRYWCRVCDCKGDAIQYCRDFLGMDFRKACTKVAIPIDQMTSSRQTKAKSDYGFEPIAPKIPSTLWQSRAGSLIENANHQLLNCPEAITILEKRGMTLETIRKYQLGWNPQDLFESKESWGLELKQCADGIQKKQWLPQGIIIPTLEDGKPIRIKIRRTNWKEEEALPKYVEISGSSSKLSFFGDLSKPMVVIESELDAILIQQFAGDICCCLALGGAAKRPDLETHLVLRRASKILLSFDYDEAGNAQYSFWLKTYPNAKPWPAPRAKSPGDAYKYFNIDLRKWIKQELI